MTTRITSIALLALTAAIASAQFTPNNLVVAEVGDGAPVPAASNLNVKLRELTTAGVFTGFEVSLTNVAGRNLTVAFGETSEAALTLTANGSNLMIGGFDLPARDGAWDRVLTPRVAAKINNLGGKTLSATFVPPSSIGSGLGDGARMVSSIDGNTFWVTGGDQGIVQGDFSGTITQFLAPAASSRSIIPFQGKFIFNGSNTVGGSNGVAEWDGVSGTYLDYFATPAGGSSRDIQMIDADTMYVAASSSGVGLVKMKRTGGVWAEEYRLSGLGVNAIATTGNGIIYVTASNGGTVRWTQDTGMAFTPWTTIATAGTDFRFRGLEFAPVAATPSITATGTVDFGQLGGTPYNSGTNLPTSIPVSFRDASNTEIATGSATYNPVTGAFSATVPGSVTVPYRVSFKHGFWLRKTMPNPVDPAAPVGNYAFGTVAPQVGDADDDNAVTPSDYGIWQVANGTFPTENTSADFDGDGAVTPSDYGLWQINNGAFGDD